MSQPPQQSSQPAQPSKPDKPVQKAAKSVIQKPKSNPTLDTGTVPHPARSPSTSFPLPEPPARTSPSENLVIPPFEKPPLPPAVPPPTREQLSLGSLVLTKTPKTIKIPSGPVFERSTQQSSDNGYEDVDDESSLRDVPMEMPNYDSEQDANFDWKRFQQVKEAQDAMNKKKK